MPETEAQNNNIQDSKAMTSEPKKSKLKINFKPILILFAIILVAFGTYYIKDRFVVALVNGRPITRAALLMETEKQSGKTVFDNLITKELIKQEAKSRGIKVTQGDLDEQIKKIEESLKSQNLTLDQVLTQQNVSKNQLIKDLTINIMVDKMVAGATNVTDADVDKYMEENKDSFKDIKPEDLADTKAQLKESLIQQQSNQAIETLIAELKAKAKISYWRQY